MIPKRIQRKRTKGWEMPKNTIYVGRPSIYGNPFKVILEKNKWPGYGGWAVYDGRIAVAHTKE